MSVGMKKMTKRTVNLLILIFIISMIFSSGVYAQSGVSLFGKNIKIEDGGTPQDYVSSIKLLLLLTVLSLAPSILIMMTSFTRIIIILSFIRNALGLQRSFAAFFKGGNKSGRGFEKSDGSRKRIYVQADEG
jgi:flagellar biosynthesis protein FliP